MADEKVGVKTGKKTQAGRDVYKSSDGEMMSEKSITFEVDGLFVNIPSIYDGVRYSEEEVYKKFMAGEIQPTSAHRTEDEAISAAKKRSNELEFSKGGTPMNRQMEMFNDGGLKDEGGMIDEESGNSVPIGGTKEGVRDDIPANISEGEFIFPADVVRYHGLDKMMALRQEAKMGLKKMEAMGQMGNSDEATIPDDMPFEMADLMIIGDDGEDVPDFAVGGIAMQPSGVTRTLPTSLTPASTVGNSTTRPLMPVQSTPPQNRPLATFRDLMGDQYLEMREYRNADGSVMMIPFLNGVPTLSIPEGYELYNAEDTATPPDATPIPPVVEDIIVDTRDNRSDSRENNQNQPPPPPTEAEFDAMTAAEYTDYMNSTVGFGRTVAKGILGLFGPIGFIGMGLMESQDRRNVARLDTYITAGKFSKVEQQSLLDVRAKVVKQSGGILSSVLSTFTSKFGVAPELTKQIIKNVDELKKAQNPVGVTKTGTVVVPPEVTLSFNASGDPSETGTTGVEKRNFFAGMDGPTPQESFSPQFYAGMDGPDGTSTISDMLSTERDLLPPPSLPDRTFRDMSPTAVQTRDSFYGTDQTTPIPIAPSTYTAPSSMNLPSLVNRADPEIGKFSDPAPAVRASSLNKTPPVDYTTPTGVLPFMQPVVNQRNTALNTLPDPTVGATDDYPKFSFEPNESGVYRAVGSYPEYNNAGDPALGLGLPPVGQDSRSQAVTNQLDGNTSYDNIVGTDAYQLNMRSPQNIDAGLLNPTQQEQVTASPTGIRDVSQYTAPKSMTTPAVDPTNTSPFDSAEYARESSLTFPDRSIDSNSRTADTKGKQVVRTTPPSTLEQNKITADMSPSFDPRKATDGYGRDIAPTLPPLTSQRPPMRPNNLGDDVIANVTETAIGDITKASLVKKREPVKTYKAGQSTMSTAWNNLPDANMNRAIQDNKVAGKQGGTTVDNYVVGQVSDGTSTGVLSDKDGFAIRSSTTNRNVFMDEQGAYHKPTLAEMIKNGLSYRQREVGEYDRDAISINSTNRKTTVTPERKNELSRSAKAKIGTDASGGDPNMAGATWTNQPGTNVLTRTFDRDNKGTTFAPSISKEFNTTYADSRENNFNAPANSTAKAGQSSSYGESEAGGGGSGDGGGKIVCTAMNNSYGFGSYRQAIWLSYSEKSLTKAHEVGYHILFQPLVDIAYKNNNKFVRSILENIARHRTADLRAEMQGKKRDTLGRVYRSILEPICYLVGKYKMFRNK